MDYVEVHSKKGIFTNVFEMFTTELNYYKENLFSIFHAHQ